MKEKVHTDKALVRRVLAGEKRAFDEFFDTYFPRLYRFTLRRVGDDEDAVKEIVHLTLCKAMRKLDTFRGEATLFTWLCCLCRNELSRYFKKRKHDAEYTVPIEDSPEIQAALESLAAPVTTEPAFNFRQTELARLVQVTLDHLPVRYGNALEWKYVQGLTVKEVGEKLGLGHDATQSLLARARQAFRDGFEDIVQTQPELVLSDIGH